MRGCIPLDEGRHHEAILRRSGTAASENAWFAARIPGGPGSTANTGTMTGHAAASDQKSPPWSAERRRRTRSQGCVPRPKSADRTHLAPSRRSTPVIVGTEKENEGRPGAQLHREAERWLRGLSDIEKDTDMSRSLGNEAQPQIAMAC
jgi:hypothetical protein